MGDRVSVVGVEICTAMGSKPTWPLTSVISLFRHMVKSATAWANTFEEMALDNAMTTFHSWFKQRKLEPIHVDIGGSCGIFAPLAAQCATTVKHATTQLPTNESDAWSLFRPYADDDNRLAMEWR